MRKLVLAILLLSAAILVGKEIIERNALNRVDRDFSSEYQWKTIDVPINLKADSVVYVAEYGGGVSIDTVLIVGYSPSNGYVFNETVLWDSTLTTAILSADTTIVGTDTTIARTYSSAAAMSAILGRTKDYGTVKHQIKYKVKKDPLGNGAYFQLFRTDLGK